MSAAFLKLVLTIMLLMLAGSAVAHSPLVNNEISSVPLAIAGLWLLAFWAAYLIGAVRVWPGLPRWLLFNIAMVVAIFALFGPLDHWAETSAAMHMVQHMLMMVFIAPLWVLAQPLPQYAVISPTGVRAAAKPLLHLARFPLTAAAVHGLIIWFWHAPKLYVLALDNDWWHFVEHGCFLASAGVFWWAVLHCGRRGAPVALLALLFTLMHTGFLGALLTFANSPLYGEGRSLQSQQLAGLIMWILGGLPYMIAAAWVAMRWFRHLQRRTASAVTAQRVVRN